MKTAIPRIFLVCLVFFTVSSFATEDIPLVNWKAPQSWKPAGEVDAMADTTRGIPFVAIAPCRVYDSRATTILPAATNRTVGMDLPACGPFPPSIGAWSVNITVTGSVPSSTYNFLTAWPAGATRPGTANVNFLGGAQVANAAVVPAGTGNDISIYASTATHVIIDINGYYSAAQNNYFHITGDWGLGLAFVNNTSSDAGASSLRGFSSGAGAVFGVSGEITSVATAGAAGVRAYAPGTGAATYGLLARSDGTADASGAIDATAAIGTWAPYLSSTTWGVRGAAGRTTSNWAVGVYGEGHDEGVVGIGRNRADDSYRNRGCLGCPGTNGVYSYNDLGAAGAKTFVEPHPTEAGKVIKFAALEGNEAGTYFRGRATIVGGQGVVLFPHEFRMVTADESITVQVTPIGKAIPIAVSYVGTDRVEFTSRTDLEFFYQVNGVRKAFPQWEAIQDDDAFFFTPSDPAARLEQVYPEEARKRLIQNGTFNPDGSVNLATAERMGWAQAWRERDASRQREAQNE